MDANATDLLKLDSFKTLSQESMCGLLARDSFFAPEVNIFVAVTDWCKFNSDVDPEVNYRKITIFFNISNVK